MKLSNKNPLLLYFSVASVSTVCFLYQSGSLIFNQIKVHGLNAQLRAAQKSAKPHSPQLSTGYMDVAALAAGKAGIKKLLSLRREENGVFESEWEASAQASLAFLDLLHASRGLGQCRQLRVSMAEELGLVRVQTSFGDGDVPQLVIPLTDEEKKQPGRNVFASLWVAPVVSNEDWRVAALKKAEAAQQEAGRRAEADRKIEEEKNRLEAKRQQLQNNLVLTGVVNNGNETLAFVNNRMGNGSTVMLRNGDVIEEARVTGMEAKKGEVYLDYLGKFQISLRINAGAGVYQ